MVFVDNIQVTYEGPFVIGSSTESVVVKQDEWKLQDTSKLQMIKHIPACELTIKTMTKKYKMK